MYKQFPGFAIEPLRTAPCSNCSQAFAIFGFTIPLKGRLPHTLQCGHCICDKCLFTQICSNNQIACKECQSTSEISQNDVRLVKENYDMMKQIFPINPYILGQLTYNYLTGAFNGPQAPYQNSPFIPAGSNVTNYVNRNQKRNNNQNYRGDFNPSGRRTDISSFISSLSICQKHPPKPLEFFCKACRISICSFCLVKNCSGHEFVLAQEQSSDFTEELTKGITAVKSIEKMLKENIESLEKNRKSMHRSNAQAKITSVESTIMSNFSKLHGKLMHAEKKLLEDVRQSRNIFDDVIHNLRNSADMLKNLETAAKLALENKGKVNVPAIVTALKSATETPWFLEDQAALMSPNVEINIDQELEENITKFCSLKINTANLKLLATSQLPSYIEKPSEVGIGEELETMSQKSGTSSHSVCTASSIDFGDYNFGFKPKGSARSDITDSTVISGAGPNVNMVKPLPVTKPEERPLKPLAKGMEEDVLVTYVESPHQIYVQRQAAQRMLHRLAESYNQIKEKLVAPEPDAIQTGATFVTYDNNLKWTRVQIAESEPIVEGKSDDDVKCLVRFMDYGHTATIATRRLRVMSEPFVPPFAFVVQLDCSPANNTWTEEDNKLIYKIISRSKNICTMTVLDVKDNIIVDLFADRVVWQDEPTSLRDALVFLGHAVLVGSSKNRIHRQGKSANFNQSTKRLPIQTHFSGGPITITSITGPHIFQARKDAISFKRLCSEMDSWYERNNEAGFIYSPAEGMIVACLIDGAWWRGQVLKLKPKGQVLVFLFDKGTSHTIEWKYIRRLVQMFWKMEELLLECKLANIKPASGNAWSKEAISFMKSHIKEDAEYHAKCVVRTKKNNSKGRTLFLYDLFVYINDNEGQQVCINNMLVKEGFATVVGKLDDPVKTPAPNTNQSSSVPPIKIKGANDVIRLEVEILSASSPSEIFVYIKSLDITGELKNLHAEMERVYKTSKPDNSSKWSVGDKCAALSKKKNQWSRAIVEAINDEKKTVKLRFKDIGMFEEMSVDNIRPLHPRFMPCPDGSTLCHLSGISPASGDKWPMLTCETLQDIINEYDTFYITKAAKIDENLKSLPIDLWIYQVTPGGALTPTIKEFRKINDRIVESGLAIPTRILNKTDENPIEVSLDEPSTSLVEEIKPDLNEVIHPPATIENWLPPTPLKHNEFTAIVTYVDDNLDLFLYDEEENASNLDLLSNFLTKYFTESKPKLYDLFWFAGQICITKYELDGKYYRAQVIEVMENNTALVRFVDYGNTQTCPISSLRKDIVLDNIPIQSYRCKLHGIKPANGETWDQHIGDLIHQTVVEKKSLITIVGEPEDGVIPVRLKVNMSHDLADLLVSLRYAVRVEEKTKQNTQPPPTTKDDDPDIIVEEEVETPEIQLFPPLVNVDWNKMNEESENEKE